jgi:hypothetical protein
MKHLIAFSALLTLGACDLQLAAMTPAPPGTTASLDSDDQSIELTRGVALGIDCRDGGLECESMAVEIDDPSVASAYLSFDSEIDRFEYSYDPYQPRTSLVLVGRTAGSTALHVFAEGGSVTYEVAVVDP